MKRTLVAIGLFVCAASLSIGCRTKPLIQTYPLDQTHNWPSNDWSVIYCPKGYGVRNVDGHVFTKPCSQLYLKPGKHSLRINGHHFCSGRTINGDVNATLEAGMAYTIRVRMTKAGWGATYIDLAEFPRRSAAAVLARKAKADK